MDWTLYRFMFPVAICVAIGASLLTVVFGFGSGLVGYWRLVCWTIPGVIIGGQIGPRLQGKAPRRTMETAITVLLAVIGVAMGWIAWRERTL